MAAQQQSQGQGDNSLSALWITIGIFALCAAIWYFFQTYIIAFILMVRHVEAYLITLILPEKWVQPLMAAQDFIKGAKQNGFVGVNLNQLIVVSNVVGAYLKYPVMILMCLLAWILYRGNAVTHFRKTYSMKKLLQSQTELWPQIVPISKLDLIHEDIDKGPWAMSMQPMQFAKKNNLLIIERVMSKDSLMTSKSILIASVNRDEARKVFVAQVGNYWTKIEDQPIYIRALFAVFAARIEGERDAPRLLLGQIGASTDTGKLDFSGTDELLAKHKDSRIVQKILKQHAFIMTVMASMLEAARSDGVVASADFLWLKPVDRRLWYMLNSIGRQVAFAEVGGPFAHWLAEKELGRPLNIPMVEEAINALNIAVKELIYIPTPEEEEQLKSQVIASKQ